MRHSLRARCAEPASRDLAHLSDEALIALVARSEEVALGELYDRYAKPSYALAIRILRDSGLAEDAVQEAFLTAWRRARTFLPERGRASTWLLTLVHRRAVDVVRRERRHRVDELDDDVELVGDPSAEDSAWLRFERERVQAALARLPDQQREVLELAYYGGFTQTQLAQRLGRPLGTIKSQMFAALASLRTDLEAGSEEESWKTS